MISFDFFFGAVACVVFSERMFLSIKFFESYLTLTVSSRLLILFLILTLSLLIILTLLSVVCASAAIMCCRKKLFLMFSSLNVDELKKSFSLTLLFVLVK